MLNVAEESEMIGENMDGFISCIGRGVRGVSVPPKTENSVRVAVHYRDKLCQLMVVDGTWYITGGMGYSIPCHSTTHTMVRKVERFPSFSVLDLV